MWQDLFSALGLVLVIEGILPFLHPRGMRRFWDQIRRTDDQTLRTTGFISMLLGLVVLYFSRG
ncbi:MAG: DUF2065 domain-containing protein [Candidatus Competibacterales bacterium]